METVIAVGRTVTLQRFEHKMIATQQIEEGIPTYHLAPAINLAQDQIEFETADAGSLAADVVYRGQQDTLTDPEPA